DPFDLKESSGWRQPFTGPSLTWQGCDESRGQEVSRTRECAAKDRPTNGQSDQPADAKPEISSRRWQRKQESFALLCLSECSGSARSEVQAPLRRFATRAAAAIPSSANVPGSGTAAASD